MGLRSQCERFEQFQGRDTIQSRGGPQMNPNDEMKGAVR
jgi:hypothetical protein